MGLGAISPFKADRLMDQQASALKAGTAGMSEAEKNQRKAKATEAAGQQVGAIQQDLSQQALASGGMGQGANTKAMLQLGGAAAQAGAVASEQIEAQSAQIAEAKRQETLAYYQQAKANKMSMIKDVAGMIAAPGLGSLGKTLNTAANRAKADGGPSGMAQAGIAAATLFPMLFPL